MASIRKRGRFWHAQIIRRGFRPLYRSFNTKLDAEAWTRQTESEMDRGVYVSRVEGERTTLAEIIARYQTEVSPTHRGAGPESIRLTAMAQHPVGSRFLAALKPMDFAEYRDERLKKVKPATVHRELGLFQQVIDQARREWGIVLPDNPVRLVRRPTFHNERDRRLQAAVDPTSTNDAKRLSEEERLFRACALLPDQARTPWLLPVVQLALLTAMRQGELLALCWSNVRLDGPEGTGTALVATSKNGRPRTVPLSRRAVEILKGLPRSIDGRVFPLSRNSLKLAWGRAVRRAGIRNLTFHDLRHEATSRLAVVLTNVLELAAVTGHRDLTMLGRYFHPHPGDLARKLG